MSGTSDGHTGRFADPVPNRSAVAEIQRNLIKQGERNSISRHLHAKSDKETIAGWRSDLNRILHVFNVRLVTSVRPRLTLHLQTELAINTSVAVSDIRHDVSEIHRTVVGSRKASDDKNQSVGGACTPSVDLTLTASQTRARSAISNTMMSTAYFPTAAPLVNLLPQHREPVSDAMS